MSATSQANGHTKRLMFDPAGIPAELRERRQWVVWRLEERLDKKGVPKLTKVPYQARNPRVGADSTDPATWTTFDEAAAAASDPANQLSGIGYVFSADDPYCGIDLDHAEFDGELERWALEIVDSMPSWAEWSQSGEGIHIIVKGALTRPDRPEPKHRKNKVGSHPRSGIEIYDRERYFCVTGNLFNGSPRGVEDCSEALEALYARLWPPKPPPKAKTTRPSGTNGTGHGGTQGDYLSSEQRLRIARDAKNGALFRALYDDGSTAYHGGDESAADLALMNLLAFYVGPDEVELERLFSLSALGQRAKWTDRPDYRQRTIRAALDGRTEFYEPQARPAQPQAGASAGGAGAGPSSAGDGGSAPGRFRLTDVGNGQRMASRHGNDLRHVHPWKKWLEFDGRRWEVDKTAEAARRAEETIISIYAAAALDPDPEERKRLASWAKASEDNRRINAMLARASCQKQIAIVPEALDRDPWLLNCANGTLDLKTGRLRPHRRSDLISKLCPTCFDPDAECPLWIKTLTRIFGGDATLIDFWQQLCGYSLSAIVAEHILVILYGKGANGKSTILNTLLNVLGTDYAMQASPDFLMAKRNDSHPTERAELFGKRLAVTIETSEHCRLDEPLIKTLTGGDKHRARRMREDTWEFDQTHKLMLCTNHKPEIRGTDLGIWRRVRLVPFLVTIPDAEQDSNLLNKLAAEAPGILTWCLQGCAKWQSHGLITPPIVEAATAEYRKQEDPLGGFFEDVCTFNPEFRTRQSQIYAAYRNWAERTGEPILTERRFGEKLIDHGQVERYTSNGTWYRGIGLQHTDEEIE